MLKLQKLDKLLAYYSDWRMPINTSKSETVIFSPQRTDHLEERKQISRSDY